MILFAKKTFYIKFCTATAEYFCRVLVKRNIKLNFLKKKLKNAR